MELEYQALLAEARLWAARNHADLIDTQQKLRKLEDRLAQLEARPFQD